MEKPSDDQIKVLQHIFKLMSILLQQEELTLDFNKIPDADTPLLKKAIEYLYKKNMIGYTTHIKDAKTGAILINMVGLMNVIPDDYVANDKPKEEVEDADTGV